MFRQAEDQEQTWILCYYQNNFSVMYFCDPNAERKTKKYIGPYPYLV